MNYQELKDYLIDNLSIEIEHGGFNNKVVVSLYVGDVLVSESTAYLPEIPNPNA